MFHLRVWHPSCDLTVHVKVVQQGDTLLPQVSTTFVAVIIVRQANIQQQNQETLLKVHAKIVVLIRLVHNKEETKHVTRVKKVQHQSRVQQCARHATQDRI